MELGKDDDDVLHVDLVLNLSLLLKLKKKREKEIICIMLLGRIFYAFGSVEVLEEKERIL